MPTRTASRAILPITALLILAGALPVPATAQDDPHSQSNPAEVRVSRLALDLRVDFPSRELRGSATLDCQRVPDANPHAPLILDTRDLNIERVTLVDASGAPRPLDFSLAPAHPILGSALQIDLPPGNTPCRVAIAYRTSPAASALQWVEPSGTADRMTPFLYSQSQAHHARSWFPCPDSPGVRFPYTAAIRVPHGLTAVMSADRLGREEHDGETTFRFQMEQPVPPYLIALAVGALDYRELGPRTGVWAAPSVVASAAWEFADAQAMLDAAETLVGPYRWGRYEILVLPPSFPFGGMENAKLTFATPTILAGDRSLVSLIAHELAHSWAGNQVTCASWGDIWLNEGLTTYLERRIVEAIYGPELAAMERVLGRASLQADLESLDDPAELLQLDAAGQDPDAVLTGIPYEKGALFLAMLESQVGRPAFDTFLRQYFDHFAFQSISTAQFEAFLDDQLLSQHPDAARRIDLDAWLRGPGLGPLAPDTTSLELDAVDHSRQAWQDGQLKTQALPWNDWPTPQRVRFVRGLPHDLTAQRMAELDQAFQITVKANPEVLVPWLEQAIRANYTAAQPRTDSFLMEVGRRKFLRPLYEAMAATPAGKERARAIFAQARAGYHPIAIADIQALLDNPDPAGK